MKTMFFLINNMSYFRGVENWLRSSYPESKTRGCEGEPLLLLFYDGKMRNRKHGWWAGSPGGPWLLGLARATLFFHVVNGSLHLRVVARLTLANEG